MLIFGAVLDARWTDWFRDFTGLNYASKKITQAYADQHYAKALDLINQQLVNDPYDAILNYNAGIALYRMQNYEQAKHAFLLSSKAERLDPVLQEQAYFNLGNCYYQLAAWQDAVDAYKKLLELHPAHQSAQHNLDLALAHLQQNQTKEQEKNENQDEQNQPQEEQNQKDCSCKNKESSTNSSDKESGQSGSSGQQQSDQNGQHEKEQQKKQDGEGESDQQVDQGDRAEQQNSDQSDNSDKKNQKYDAQNRSEDKHDMQQQDQSKQQIDKHIGQDKQDDQIERAGMAEESLPIDHKLDKQDQQVVQSVQLQNKFEQQYQEKASQDDRLTERNAAMLERLEQIEEKIHKHLIKNKVTAQGVGDYGKKGW